MNDVSERAHRIGKHMVEVVVASLHNGTMSVERAKHVASFYLQKLHPADSHEALDTQMHTMLQELPEMQVVVRSDKMKGAHQ